MRPRADASAAQLRDVFISYAREDGEFVRRLHDAFAERGTQAWIDHADIPGGEPWRQRVELGIEQAKAVVAVLSPAAIVSGPCNDEIEHAVRLRKRIVPVVCRTIDDEALREDVGALNYISFVDGQFDERFERVVEAIERDQPWLDQHARLLGRATEWDRAGRSRGFLLHGGGLANAERWLAEQGEHAERATKLQTEFILASRRAATLRQRKVLGAVVLALTVSIGLGVAAWLARNEAVDQRREAVAQRRTAESRELAGSSAAALPADRQLGLLLALQAVDRDDTEAALDALRRAVEALSPADGRLLARLDERPLGFDPAGTALVTWHRRGDVVLRTADGRRPLRLRGAVRGPFAFSSDGERAAGATSAGAAVWATRSGRPMAALGGLDDVRSLSFADDAGRVAGAGPKGLLVWDADTGEPLTSGDGARAALFDPRGLWLVAVRGREAIVWNLVAGLTRVKTVREAEPIERAWFSRRDGFLLTTTRSVTRIWSPGTFLERAKLALGDVRSARFSADDRFVVLVPGREAPVIRSTSSGRLVQRLGRERAVDAAFGSGGEVLVAEPDGALRALPCVACVSNSELRRRADRLVTRRLTREERRAYLHEPITERCQEGATPVTLPGGQLVCNPSLDPDERGP